MNDPKHIKNFAFSKGPVNRRTAPAAPREPAQPSASALTRMRLTQLKQRLGAPLTQQLGADRTQQNHSPLPTPSVIMRVVASTVGASALVLGLIQGSMLWTLAGSSLLGLCGLWTLARRAKSGPIQPAALSWQPQVQASELARLDQLMETMAAQAPASTMTQLQTLKATLVRCVSVIGQDPMAQTLCSDEHLYVREAIRRYVPDSIDAYLRVPAHGRATQTLDNGQTALALLNAQLTLIEEQLALREQRLSMNAGEALMRQHRFLSAKTGATSPL